MDIKLINAISCTYAGFVPLHYICQLFLQIQLFYIHHAQTAISIWLKIFANAARNINTL